MSTLISPIRPPTFPRGPGRIVEHTTTTTREIFLDDLPATKSRAGSASPHSSETAAELLTTSSDMRLHGLNRAMVRLGVWLIEAGRRHALRPAVGPAARADEIARRVDAAKAHDMRHFIGLPN